MLAGIAFLGVGGVAQLMSLVMPWAVLGNVWIRGTEYGSYLLAPNRMCLHPEDRGAKVRALAAFQPLCVRACVVRGATACCLLLPQCVDWHSVIAMSVSACCNTRESLEWVGVLLSVAFISNFVGAAVAALGLFQCRSRPGTVFFAGFFGFVSFMLSASAVLNVLSSPWVKPSAWTFCLLTPDSYFKWTDGYYVALFSMLFSLAAVCCLCFWSCMPCRWVRAHAPRRVPMTCTCFSVAVRVCVRALVPCSARCPPTSPSRTPFGRSGACAS